MMIFFWVLVALLVVWYLGVMSLAYHVFAFRFPRDITLFMLGVFIVITAPISLFAVSYLSQFYGGLY